MRNEAMSFEFKLPDCPECGGDMMGYRPAGGDFLIWACRACGSSFVYDEGYTLQPYLDLSLIPLGDEEDHEGEVPVADAPQS